MSKFVKFVAAYVAVVCGFGAMAIFCPIRAFISVLLPTFGLPTRQTYPDFISILSVSVLTQIPMTHCRKSVVHIFPPYAYAI